VIGVSVACLPAGAIAGYHLSSSGDWHAQARIVAGPGALPDFSALMAGLVQAGVRRGGQLPGDSKVGWAQGTWMKSQRKGPSTDWRSAFWPRVALAAIAFLVAQW